MRSMLLLCLCVLLVSGCTSQAETPTPELPAEDDSEQAVEASQLNLETFIAAIESGDGQDFAVQTFIDEEVGTKNFWVTGVTFDSGQFTGTVEDVADRIPSLQAGQQWTVAQGDVTDWKYLRNDQVIRPPAESSE